LAFRHGRTALLVAVALLLISAGPAHATKRTIGWASPPGAGAAGTHFGVEFGSQERGDVCGDRTVVNPSLPSDVITDAATPDGSKLFFLTQERLTGGDTDNFRDVYEFSGGQTKLVSIFSGSTTADAYFVGCSADGTHLFFLSAFGAGYVDLFDRDTSASTTTQVDGPLRAPTRLAVSGDGLTVALETTERLTGDDTDPSDDTGVDVYVRSGGTTRLVTTNTGDNNVLKGISADGSRVYFTSGSSYAGGSDANGTTDVYVEENGTTKRLLSADDSGNAVTGDFAGVTSTGSHAYFTTAASVPGSGSGDTGGSDLYDRNVAGSTTSWLSKPDAGGSQGQSFNFDLLAASPDGSRVWFNNDGRLKSTDTDSSGDLYLRSGSSLVHVTRQLAGGSFPVQTGCQENGAVRNCASTDASKIFFLTQERLVAADTNTHSDLYRFTAPSGPLQLVSGNGNDEISIRGVSTDGSRVLFDTERRLLPCADKDALGDVYEWQNGALTLVSPPVGSGPESNLLATMSETGSTVFFISSARYPGADNDGGLLDLFAARPGAGGIQPAACPTPFKPKQPTGGGVKPLTAATIRSTLSGDLKPALKSVAKLGIAKVLKSKGFTLKGLDILDAGKLSGQATATTARKAGASRRFVVAKGSKRFSKKTGRGRLKLKLTRKGKRALKRAHKRITLTVKLTFSAKSGAKASASRKLKLKRKRKRNRR
jgi:Tol biopolymer transport system component